MNGREQCRIFFLAPYWRGSHSISRGKKTGSPSFFCLPAILSTILKGIPFHEPGERNAATPPWHHFKGMARNMRQPFCHQLGRHSKPELNFAAILFGLLWCVFYTSSRTDTSNKCQNTTLMCQKLPMRYNKHLKNSTIERINSEDMDYDAKLHCESNVVDHISPASILVTKEQTKQTSAIRR